MSVVATSVFLLFALIVLGFILGKRNIIHKEVYRTCLHWYCRLLCRSLFLLDH